MTWNLRYQVKSYIRSALWIIPLFALLLEQVAGALAQALDAHLAWEGLGFGVNGAQALLNAITTLTLSFIVFTFASLLVAIQVASRQYTPRIIATTLLRDNVIRYTVGLFVFHVPFRDKGSGPDRDHSSPVRGDHCGAPCFELYRSFPVFDRLRGENVASGQSGTARRAGRARGDGECLS